MAESDKIKSSDIIQDDLFKNTIQSAEDLTKVLIGLENEFVKVAESQAKIAKNTAKNLANAESLQKTTQAITEASKARERANKIAKERVSLEQKLKIAVSTSVDKNTELKVLIQEQNKINKEFAKEKLGLISSYEKESKTLNKLRKQYKNLAVEGKENTKESKELLKQITKLDRKLKDIDASVGQAQRNVGNYTEAIKESAKGITDWAKALVGAKLGLDGLGEAINANEESASAFEETVGFLKGGFTALASSVGGFLSDVVSGEFDEALNNFDNLGENITKSANAGRDAAKSQREFAKELRPLNEELAKINGTIERQNSIAGDTTLSFDKQEEAAKKAQKAQIERSQILFEIAQKELDIVNQQIEARGEGANVEDLLNEKTEKTIALTEAQNELDLATVENQKVLREVRRDRFERELDFAIDAFDAQKTVNERQLADDRKTIEEREGIFDETVRLADKSFESQKKLFKDFVSDKVDFDALVAETDEEAIRRTIRQLDLDDVELGRALEVIRERKIVLQDLDDAERDLDDKRTERADNEAKRQEEETAKKKEEAEKQKKILDDLKQKEIDTQRAIEDARLSTAKSVSEVSKIIAGDNEKAQKAALIAEKAIATSELLINLQREISDIRRRNADNDTPALNAPQIAAATASTFAGIATIASQSFFDGTENTGNGGRVDDRGGFYAVLHPNERVMTARQNAKVGELTNNELADIALMYNRGELINPFTDMAINVVSKQDKKDNTNILASKLDALKQSIDSKPIQQVNVDSFGNLVEVVYRNGVKDTVKYKHKKWL